MAKLKDGWVQVSFHAPKVLLVRLKALLEQTQRGVGEEWIHAMERHLAAPPVLTITTPPLDKPSAAGRKSRKGADK